MEISTGNNVTCIGEYQWIVCRTIHLCSDDILYEFHRIEWDTMNLDDTLQKNFSSNEIYLRNASNWISFLNFSTISMTIKNNRWMNRWR